ncbi:MAG: transcription termination/antitermination NusG family protein [Thermodesulfovibrionales bacterium]
MWYAVYTKPKKEDSVAFLLQNIGLEVLNPKIKFRKFKRNRLTDVIEPLFPCYLFANFDKDKYSHLITYTRGVRYVVGKKNPLVVQDEVVNVIKDGIEDNNLIVIKPSTFKNGDKVLIKDGPFKDFYGIFEKEIKGHERVMILLETIQCRLELDSYFLAVA